jgi:serine/threonine protein kinase
MSRCPSSQRLQDWLAERLAGLEAAAVEAHVESCAACQQRLEELTGNAARTAPEPEGRDGSGGDFLRRLEQAPPTIARVAPELDGEAALILPTLDAAAERGPSAVAGYEVLEELGRGGMGVVYKARHRPLHRLVALKMVLAGAHAGQQHRERFLHEAEAVARLQHPHIVQIYEVGEHDGRPFLALEYVPGGSLAQRLDGTPQPPRDAAELIQTLARAVQAAHEQGVVHRDLKPANVLLAEDGTPKLTDFGLAKQLDPACRSSVLDGAGQTPSGAVLLRSMCGWGPLSPDPASRAELLRSMCGWGPSASCSACWRYFPLPESGTVSEPCQHSRQNPGIGHVLPRRAAVKPN